MAEVKYFHPIYAWRDADYDEVVRILDRTRAALASLIEACTEWHVEESDAGRIPELDGWPDVPRFVWLAYMCGADVADAKAILDAIMAAHIDGPEQKPGRKSLDATVARASVSVTFCKDDGCMYTAGHAGPHDITWQDAHSDGPGPISGDGA